jgi:hypothetical protein
MIEDEEISCKPQLIRLVFTYKSAENPGFSMSAAK